MIKRSFQKNVTLPFVSKFSLNALRLTSSVLFFIFLLRFLKEHSSAEALKCAQCIGIFALSFLPKLLKTEGDTSTLIFSSFLFLASVLGSLGELYSRFRFYDVFVHSISGIVCAVVLFDLLKRKNIKLSASGFFILSLVFTLSLASAWEMYEFVAFTALKNTKISLNFLSGELGIPIFKTVSESFVKQNAAISFGQTESVLRNEFDTFCDILCAVFWAVISSAFITKSQHFNFKNIYSSKKIHIVNTFKM